MPELPEVETVKAALAPVMTGAMIIKAEIRRPNLRWPLAPDLAKRLEGQLVYEVARRAKIIQIKLASETALLHLGMSGSVRISDHKPNSQPHDHIELTLKRNNQYHYITYNDPRRFGYFDMMAHDAVATNPSIASLGPEPLSDEFSEAYLQQKLAGSSAPIKSFLLDQRKVAGLGNIYVCEALYRAGISPRRKASSVKGKRATRLISAIQSVLTDAIAQGGTSLRDHRQPDGALGYFVQQLDVYGREGKPCHHCQTSLKSITQSGRTTTYCPNCQR